MTSPQLWDGVLRRLGDELPAFAMEAWLAPLAPEVDGDRLILRCPSAFHRDRVRERFLATLVARASDVARRPIEVVLELAPLRVVAGARPQAVEARDCESASVARAAAGPAVAHAPERPPAERSAGTVRLVAGATVSAPAQQYSFDSFVVGPCNALAREASLALARGSQPGVCPLYIAAPSGLGKTHLARALTREARRHGLERSLYVSAEAFTSEFLSSVRGQRMGAFKRRYREQCDLLVLEDVQFLSGKKSTQLELFHTLEHLLDAGSRIVLTADREPRELEDLEPRLRSKIMGGLVAVIEPPDARVRRQILRQKAAAGGVRLPDACLDRLVERVRGSVRDLEGVLIQVVATASLLKRPIDVELTELALRKMGADGRAESPLEIRQVVQVVAGYFKSSPAALAARSRRRDVLVPRQLAMYLCRRYTDASLAQIGQALGRDHPAVSHAIRIVERRILERAPLRYQVEAIAARLDDLRAGGREEDRRS